MNTPSTGRNTWRRNALALIGVNDSVRDVDSSGKGLVVSGF